MFQTEEGFLWLKVWVVLFEITLYFINFFPYEVFFDESW